jgi:hypothetical protein
MKEIRLKLAKEELVRRSWWSIRGNALKLPKC